MIICGDALTELRKLPDESVNCCVCSPPYWGLRNYGVEGQLGLEKTPEEYVSHLVEVFHEVRRVLRSDGTLWLNLGDSYAASGVSGLDKQGASSTVGKANPRSHQSKTVPAGLKPKDLVGIPWRVAFALQADGWWLRQDIIWAKPNPMPESVTDRCTKAHEYIFMLSKSARYWYDAEAVKENRTTEHDGHVFGGNKYTPESCGKHSVGSHYKSNGSRNLRSVWTITTKPFKEAHFATFPPEIPERCIKAGCPAKVCAKCGEPWERVMEKGERIQAHWEGTTQNHAIAAKGHHGKTSVIETGSYQTYKTTGFRPACSCDAGTTSGTVLDPFFGAGTTGLVAMKLGRDFIGIELNQAYCDMAQKRIYGELMT